MPPKPLAVRTLEQRRVAYELFEFDLAVRDAAEVARLVGVDPRLVYKTLVIEHDPPRGKPYLVMVPSDSEVDLKFLASNLGAKRLRMASHRDAERHTGLQVGGISALALLNRGFPVLLDERALHLPEILVSAGQRGIDVRLAVTDLITLTRARTVTTC
ncbi:MAG TPA: aminoacyl-tRNA deacylase [Tepidiformaceae bacterium]|nr:aminoacyl-tRNA deacylase [Tepidiformaceae bacterium]